MRRVLRPQTAQDRDRLLDRRFVDLDRLKTPFERRIGLDVLAELVERRGADALQLAASQLGLDHRAQVERTFGRAGADQRVQLVDEQDDVAAGAFDLVEDALDAAFELTAILGPRHQRPERQREHALLAQRGRDVAHRDPLRESLDDRGLADARLADENRVVLAAPGQDRDDPFDLVAAADDGVELAALGRLGEVARVLPQGRAAAEDPAEVAQGLGLLGRLAARIAAAVHRVDRQRGAAEQRRCSGRDPQDRQRGAAPLFGAVVAYLGLDPAPGTEREVPHAGRLLAADLAGCGHLPHLPAASRRGFGDATPRVTTKP